MDPTPGSESSIPLKYSANFRADGNYFKEFEEQLQAGELYAYKDLPTGRLKYRYSDGAVFLNDKGVENRRGAMLELFHLDGVGSKEVLATWKRRNKRRKSRYFWWGRSLPQYKEVDVTAASGNGVVCKFRNRWIEITKVMDEKGGKLTRDNGMPFTEDVPSSTMAHPGYEPMIRHSFGVISPGPECALVSKTNAVEGVCDVWVRPSDLHVFVESMKPTQRVGKLRRCQQWKKYRDLFRIVRLKGITEPAGAIGAAQFTKMILGI